MKNIVEEGTGTVAQITGYQIGGKTGTAQKASPNGGYIKGARIASFVAILLMESPQYVVFAIANEPKGENAFGGTVAAPIVKSVIAAHSLAIDQIPPNKEQGKQRELEKTGENEGLGVYTQYRRHKHKDI